MSASVTTPTTLRFTDFQNLMRRRVREILMVSSVYDSFLLSQDGELREQVISEFMELNLQHAPGLTRVSLPEEALELLGNGSQFDLIIVTPHVGDMPLRQFAERARELQPETPVVLLTFDSRETAGLVEYGTRRVIDRVFMWHGDFRILLAIVKDVEDRWNADHDVAETGVQVIILIEDNIAFYSSYLPMIFTEVMSHSQSLISESVNLYHRLQRMRARPKVLLCERFEEAWDYFERFEPFVLGIISDVEFPFEGRVHPQAGVRFSERVRSRRNDVPILLQSSTSDVGQIATSLGVKWARKDSPVLLQELRQFMRNEMGFGDFLFRLPSGEIVDRASSMRELEERLRTVSAESIRFHAERDHFSSWLKVRTEFELADALKPRKVEDYATIEDLRRDLIDSIAAFRRERARGRVADFHPEQFDPQSGFSRIGGGSLGGKARGLAFASRLLSTPNLTPAVSGVTVTVPATVVLCTDLFDRFLDRNGLREFALHCEDEEELQRRFLASELPVETVDYLQALLKLARYPLAVRSSSLLEDSQFHPFAGVYRTEMIPNNHPLSAVRLAQLTAAIKRVYASTFSISARRYMEATGFRPEEEKMAIIIQQLVGRRHELRFYPDFSGVARSHNFYPTPPMSARDGVATVALGLGRTVVEGRSALRFCPKYPRHLIQFAHASDFLEYTQRSFFALELDDPLKEIDPESEIELKSCSLDLAERDGTLDLLGSVYSLEDDAVHDGLGHPGTRIVSFAPILKHRLFPLPELVQVVLQMGERGMNGPVEIEFAVVTSRDESSPGEFAILQMRPLVLSREVHELSIAEHASEEMICHSTKVLGVGRIDDIHDLVVVDREKFVRAQSRQVAAEVGWFNARLAAARTPYLLVGMGRWGSADPWLGIPTAWEQISGARVIVETGFKDFVVTPSQGAHFFQNLVALRIGYFTLNPDQGDGFLDWEWLMRQPVHEQTPYVRHLRFPEPIVVKMNGYQQQGVILKPRGS